MAVYNDDDDDDEVMDHFLQHWPRQNTIINSCHCIAAAAQSNIHHCLSSAHFIHQISNHDDKNMRI